MNLARRLLDLLPDHRLIPPPRGPGRWQIWQHPAWRDGAAELVGCYRTKFNAWAVAWMQDRRYPNWRHIVRRTRIERG